MQNIEMKRMEYKVVWIMLNETLLEAIQTIFIECINPWLIE